MLSPLRDARFARLFVAQVTALVGTGLTTVALGLLAYELAGGGAGLVLGGLLALKMVAYVGVAPVAGALAHRIPRRRMLVTMDLLRASAVMAMPLVGEVWQVFVLVFLLNAASAAFTPTFQATIPDILTEEGRYTRALSLSRLAYDLEKLTSPALTALALMLVGFDWLFVANGAAFLISAGLVLSVRLPKAGPAEREGGIGEDLRSGARVYLWTPRLRGLLALSMTVAAAGSMVIVNTVVIVRDAFGHGESAVAWALAAAGVGSMLAAITAPMALDRLGDRTAMLSGALLAVSGLVLAPLVIGSSWVGLLGLWIVLGAGTSLIQTPAGRLLRRSCREGDRPAVFAAQFALSHGCWFLAYPLAGWAGAALGLDAAALMLAVIAGGGALTALALWPADDPGTLAHEHAELRHEHLHVHDEHHQHDHEGWEGPEPHRHPHRHRPMRHRHAFVIDLHHRHWPAD